MTAIKVFSISKKYIVINLLNSKEPQVFILKQKQRFDDKADIQKRKPAQQMAMLGISKY